MRKQTATFLFYIVYLNVEVCSNLQTDLKTMDQIKLLNDYFLSKVSTENKKYTKHT